MAMPWSRRRRIAEETRLASCASRGRWVRRTPPAALRRRSARGQFVPACARPGSGRAPAVLGRSPAASFAGKIAPWRPSSVGDPAPPAGAILLAEKHRFRDGKVRDQVKLLVNDANAGGFNGCRIAEGQRVTVEGRAAAVSLIDAGEDFNQRRFTGAVLANQAMNFPGLRRRVTELSAVTLAKRLPIWSMTRPAAGRSPPGC